MVRNIRWFVPGLVLAILTPTLSGQEKAVEEELESGPPIRAGAVIVAGSSSGGPMEIQSFEMAAPVALQFLDAGPMSFAPMMFGGGGVQANSIGWLQNDDILDELEIVSGQRDRLGQLQQSIQKRRQDFFKTMSEVPAEKRMEFIREFSTVLTANVDGQIKDILLPHQLERFEQLRFQTQMRKGGLNAAQNAELAKLLGITDQQKEQMKEKQAKVQEELRKKLEVLRKEAQNEVLSVLTPAQRKKLDKLLGKEYEFKPRSMFSRLPQSGSRVKAEAKDDKDDKDDKGGN